MTDKSQESFIYLVHFVCHSVNHGWYALAIVYYIEKLLIQSALAKALGPVLRASPACVCASVSCCRFLVVFPFLFCFLRRSCCCNPGWHHHTKLPLCFLGFQCITCRVLLRCRSYICEQFVGLETRCVSRFPKPWVGAHQYCRKMFEKLQLFPANSSYSPFYPS